MNGRPIVSQKVIDIISNVVDSQDQKGMEKYGKTIDQAHDHNYDWQMMAIEELVDAMKYMVKENERLARELKSREVLRPMGVLDK